MPCHATIATIAIAHPAEGCAKMLLPGATTWEISRDLSCCGCAVVEKKNGPALQLATNSNASLHRDADRTIQTMKNMYSAVLQWHSCIMIEVDISSIA